MVLFLFFPWEFPADFFPCRGGPGPPGRRTARRELHGQAGEESDAGDAFGREFHGQKHHDSTPKSP